MLPTSNFRSGDRYAARNAPRVRIRVDVMPISGVQVCGMHFPHGVSEQVIYKDQLDDVRARLQSDADRKTLELATIAAEKKGTHYALEFFQLTEKVKRTGIPPIKSLEIVAELGAPETPEGITAEQVKTQTQALTMLAEIMKQLATAKGK